MKRLIDFCCIAAEEHQAEAHGRTPPYFASQQGVGVLLATLSSHQSTAMPLDQLATLSSQQQASMFSHLLQLA